MRLRYTLSGRQIRCFASVPVLSLVVTKHCTDDTRVVTDECIEGIDASHSRYADLINNVANGGAVLTVECLSVFSYRRCSGWNYW